jgi:hypothetical protein
VHKEHAITVCVGAFLSFLSFLVYEMIASPAVPEKQRVDWLVNPHFSVSVRPVGLVQDQKATGLFYFHFTLA